ncbi:MAG: 3'(2'),5'-bisphosphate nucleotidase CysQ [Alphaproteobacteria bacterium]
MHAAPSMPKEIPTLGSLAEDHALLCRAVREAGLLASKRFHAGEKGWDKRPGQPVSQADIAVDAYLEQELIGARPSYGWLSEESGESDNRLSTARIFIVDPIDGTRAFLKKRPEYAVSVALVASGRPVAAAVYNPETDEFFEAFEGGGARCNGAPMRVQDRTQLRGTKLLVSRHEFKELGVDPGLEECEIEAISSIAYKIALVAAGRAGAVIALRPKSEWDLAAADLLVTEAGGRITDAGGAELIYNQPAPDIASVLAAGPVLHALLLERVARGANQAKRHA